MGLILWGILFIIGGASGQFVLRGTQSSGLLVVVGAGMVIWGIISMTQNKSAKAKAEIEKQGGVNTVLASSQMLSLPCRVEIIREKKFAGAITAYDISINERAIGRLENGITLITETDRDRNLLTAPTLSGAYEFAASPGGLVRLRFTGVGLPNKEGQFFELLNPVQPMIRG